MKLFTQRLRLREYVESDVHETHMWRCDSRYLEHYAEDGFERSHTVELIERFIGWQTERPRRRWQLAFERLDTGQLIGSGGVRRSGEEGRAEIGYELHPEHLGAGFATEGMTRLVRFAFAEAGLALLTAQVSQANLRSLNVLERLGFQCAEELPAGRGPDGKLWPDRFEFHLESSPTLRKATPADSDFAYEVKKAAFRGYIEQAKAWDDADQRRQHERRFAEQEFQIVMWNSMPIGVIAVVVEHAYLKLNQLFIHPQRQGMGIGGHCLAMVLDRARGLQLPVWLQCMKVNPRAVAFYVRHGFRVTGDDETHLSLESA